MNEDDGLNFANNSENSFHVVIGSGTDESAELDGFTISGGNANGVRPRNRHGGGMYNVAGSPKIRDCTFNGDYTENNGGGMYNEEGNPILTGCKFTGNSAIFGSGVYNNMSNASLTNCVFSNNSAMMSGGGMYNNDNSNPELFSCLFVGNLAIYEGGGIFNNMSDANLTNCIFSGNSASYGGGMLNDNNRPTLTNCTFSRNSADEGGGTYNDHAYPHLTNCIFWCNSDSVGIDELAQIYMYSGIPTINYCCVQGWRGDWLGEGNCNWDPLFVDADGADNLPGTEDDNLQLSPRSACIDAGDNTAVPADTADLDADDDTTEPTSWDFEGNLRFIDDLHTNDTGNGIPPIVDMEAFEFSQPPGLGEILYVDADANGANDGTSWSSAITCLQEALKIAAGWMHVVREIRVANGVYTPAEPNGFKLIRNLAIKGGYAGCGESDPNAPDIYLDPNIRDIDLYETILSGDLNGDDANMTDPCDYLTDPNRVDNSYHVVTATRTDANTVLDGFTISGGIANGAHDRSGGGMYIMRGNPTIIRCTFKGNAAEDNGGGIHCYESDPSIRNCTFRQNFARLGGGISCDCQSSPSITDNQIKGNRAGDHGGGIYCENSSEPSVLRNKIVDNTANDGGGIYCSGSDPNILNNIIVKNIVVDDGGGICCEENSNPTIRNNTIVRNRANPQGGGIFCEDSEPVITHCIIWKNGDDLHNYSSGEDCNATYCCIEDSSEGLGEHLAGSLFREPGQRRLSFEVIFALHRCGRSQFRHDRRN